MRLFLILPGQRYLVVDRTDLPYLGIAPGAVVLADELVDAGP